MTVMLGGAKFHQAVIQWTNQSNNLYLAVTNSIIFLWALYADKLPAVWRWQLSTSIGRLLLLVLLYIVFTLAGFISALLFSIAMALTWANRPLYKPLEVREQFDNIKVTDITSKKWFVEKVLYEEPKSIIQDRISTQAIQDDYASSAGRTSR